MDFPQREKVVRETAKNATRIRKAFDEAFNAAAIARAWSETHPAGEPVSPQMARDWALAHAVVKKKPLEVALSRLYADGYTLGERIAKGRVLRMVTKGVGVGVVDWTTWAPGMPSASALVKPTGGLEELLRSRKITITDDIVRTKLDRIGSSLSRSLERGEDAFSTARGINQIINDPQHALMIARTEMARSMSVASRDVYKENSVQQVEWLVAEGCEDCQENADASPLPIDEPFPTGDFEPPAHPNCECAIAPVFDDADLPAVEDVPTEGDESGSLEGGDLETEIQPAEVFAEIMQEAPTVYVQATTLAEQAELMNLSAPLKQSLSIRQKKVLEEYQTFGNKKMNAILRTPSQIKNQNSRLYMGDDSIRFYKEYIKELDGVMKYRPTFLPENTLTYRGVNGEVGRKFQNLKPGEVMQDKGFVSTSLSKDVPSEFVTNDGYLMVIENPKGTTGIFPATARKGPLTEAELSGINGEAEWLMPRNSKFEILENILPTGGKPGVLKVRVVK